MAKYHENLKYHEDDIEKHRITDEEISFLKELQKEMNTQDNVSQANPRFWVIKGTEKLYNVEDEDGFELYDKDDCETVADNMKEILEFIKNDLLEDICSDSGVEYKLSLQEGIFNDSILVQWLEDEYEEEEELETQEDVANWIKKFGYDEYEVITYKIIPKIYENTMFLTQEDAENHLKSNDYHYSDDAHTYAMTAWRSPRVEKLVGILQKVDW